MIINVPDEEGIILKFSQDGKTGIASINTSLTDNDTRKVFRWHGSIVLYFDEQVENGLPSEANNNLANKFEDRVLDVLNENNNKPIGIWLANMTWNNTKEIILRLHDPVPLSGFLDHLIKMKSHIIKFSYELVDDPEWNKAIWIDEQIDKMK